MGLFKIKNGLISYDEFSDSIGSICEIIPNDETRYSLTDKPGYLRLKHGLLPISVLANVSEYEDLVLEIKNDYFPSTPGESGGIYILQDNQRNIEFFEEYKINSTDSLYTYMKIEKKNGVILAYTSMDGKIWQYVGNLILDNINYVGVKLNGLSGCDYDIDYIKLYEGKKITIRNVLDSMRVELYSSTNALISEMDTSPGIKDIDMEFENYPINGYFKFYDSLGNLITRTSNMTLWGGDIYQFGRTLDIYIDSKKLECYDETDLGYLQGDGTIEIKMKLVNNTSQDESNIQLDVGPYGDTYGSQLTKLAADNNGSPDAYNVFLSIDEVLAGQTKYFWLKVDRGYLILQPTIDPYMFMININFN